MRMPSNLMRDKNFVTRDLVSALAICHNVTPTYTNEGGNDIKEFMASSPDEVALVRFADEMGIKLHKRN